MGAPVGWGVDFEVVFVDEVVAGVAQQGEVGHECEAAVSPEPDVVRFGFLDGGAAADAAAVAGC